MNVLQWARLVSGRFSARRQAYDLDVVDQWTLVLLRRYRACTYRRLEAELSAIRGTPPAEVVAALLKLEGFLLLERVPEPELMAVERRFRLAAAGRRLGGHLPAEPRSPTIFYV
ncbi:MAG: hypothetical protein ACYDCQ_05545 [Dehalococcoidia bacterium]